MQPSAAALGLAAALAVSLAMCGVENAANTRAMVRDSAGIEIVESGTPVWSGTDRWRVGDEPTVDIGVLDGDPAYQLHDVTAAVRAADRRILVANSGTAEIRIYDADGRFLRALGGSGDGPGEFRTIDWIQSTPGDTVIAFDLGRRRLTVFSPRGDVVRTATLEEQAGLPMGPVYRLGDGSYIVGWDTGDLWARVEAGAVGPGDVVRSTALVVRHSADGAVLDTVGRFPGYEAALRESGGRVRPSRPPFGRSFAYAARRADVYVGTQATYELRVHSPAGRLVRLVRRSAVDLGITDEGLDALRRRVLAATDDPARRRYLERTFTTLPTPDRRAAYGRVLLDALGHLWVADYSHPYLTPTRWSVFDRSGVLLGSVVVPEHFRILEVGRDYLLGVWRSELDVEHVRLYPLLKPDASQRVTPEARSPVPPGAAGTGRSSGR